MKTGEKKVNTIMHDGQMYYCYYINYISKDGHMYNDKWVEIRPKNGKIWFRTGKKNKDGTPNRRYLRFTRVVYEAVTGKTLDKKTEIKQINGDLNDYRFENLQISKENETIKHRPREGYYKKPAEIRKQIVQEYNYEEHFKKGTWGKTSKPSMKELAEKYGLNVMTVSRYIHEDLEARKEELEKKGISLNRRKKN